MKIGISSCSDSCNTFFGGCFKVKLKHRNNCARILSQRLGCFFFRVLRLSYRVKLNFNLVLILVALDSCNRYFRNKMY